MPNCGEHPGVSTLSTPDVILLRNGLGAAAAGWNARRHGRVAFLGGSITEADGWRSATMDMLRTRFPGVTFDAVAVGIGSTDSTYGAFRLARDILSTGDIDLLFIESAVNELHNSRTEDEIIRGTEGIIRHALRARPGIGIVAQYFSDPRHIQSLENGTVPMQIACIDRVTRHYGITAIDQNKALTLAYRAGTMTPGRFSRDGVHPAPDGHAFYAANIGRLFDVAWGTPAHAPTKAVSLPTPLSTASFSNGRFAALEDAACGDGWALHHDYALTGADTRAQFNHCPMLVAERPGAELRLAFTGNAVAIVVAAGPDAGMAEYQIDGAPSRTLDLFTPWSSGLHIPWIYVLAHGLPDGRHDLTLRPSTQKNAKSTGHAIRICHLGVNGPEHA